MNKKNKGMIFLIYFIIGIYLINFAFKFYEIPEAISSLEIYIIGIAGFLVILGGINYLRIPVKGS